jgi:hypothetical protein
MTLQTQADLWDLALRRRDYYSPCSGRRNLYSDSVRFMDASKQLDIHDLQLPRRPQDPLEQRSAE